MFGLTSITFGVPYNSWDGNTWLSFKKFFFGMELGSGILEGGGNSSSVILIEEGKTQEEIREKIIQKQEKLDLFLRIMCNASLARPFQETIHYYKTREDIFQNYYDFEDYFKNIDEQAFIDFLDSSIKSSDSNFLDALLTWNSDISKFAEIAEYYEEISSDKKYRCLRNCFSHSEAFEKDITDVNTNFPNQFEFIGRSLNRKSEKNKKSLEVLVENILSELKSIFPEKYNFKK